MTDYYYSEMGSNANGTKFREAAKQAFERLGIPTDDVHFDQNAEYAIAMLTVGDE